MPSSVRRLFLQVAGALLAVAVCALVKASLGVPILPFLFFFPAVMLSAFYLGRVGGLVAAFGSTVVALYLFIPPAYSFAITDLGLGIGVLLFLTVSSAVALLISLLRENADRLAREVAAAVAEVERTNEILRQSQKLEAVGQLTGGVAHDFNNLLTVIRSSTDLLKRPNLSEERRARYVGAISETVDRAARLTGQLLAFARRQALTPEVFAAGESVRGLVEMMKTLSGSRIRIVTVLPDDACYIDADASQFDTALVNLAVNARDAMNGEGEITVEVAAAEGIPPVRAHPAVGGAYVAISMRDTGPGITPDSMERIFEPFFTTKEVGKGTGLGLSQVFGFAKQSGGDITVASTIGKGAIFTLYLPRVPAPERPRSVEPAEPLADGHGIRVLVVEDNVEVGAFAVQTLGDLDYHPVLASTGPAALALLAADNAGFDVVFSDVMMPGMTGIELGREIRRLHPGLPVVLTSGYSHVLAEKGSHGFELLHKPYSVEALAQALEKSVACSRRTRLKPKSG